MSGFQEKPKSVSAPNANHPTGTFPESPKRKNRVESIRARLTILGGRFSPAGPCPFQKQGERGNER